MLRNRLRKTQWYARTLSTMIGSAVLVAAMVSAAGAGEPVRLRVLSYNIHHARGIDDVLDLERIAGVINEVEPDIVALQEVDRNVERSEGGDQPSELARLTGTEAIFERNISVQGGEYGNALLSKLPILEHRNVHLPKVVEGEQRGCLVVDLEGPGDSGTIRVFATHLDHRRPEADRLASADRISEIVAEHPDRPAILMGDLNAVPESETLKRFDQDWSRTHEEPLLTIPVGEPNRQIDYILVRPEGRWRVVEVRVIDEQVASDHRPIFAVLELVNPEE